MSYEHALADLKEQFGSKKLLTPSEVAKVIPRCVKTIRQIINSTDSPLPPKAVGKRVCVSVYDVARFLADSEEPAPKSAVPTKAQRVPPMPRQSRTSGLDPTKPYRRPPSLGRLISGFQRRIDDLELRLRFERELLAELEKAKLTRDVGKARDAKRSPSRGKAMRL